MKLHELLIPPLPPTPQESAKRILERLAAERLAAQQVGKVIIKGEEYE